MEEVNQHGKSLTGKDSHGKVLAEAKRDIGLFREKPVFFISGQNCQGIILEGVQAAVQGKRSTACRMMFAVPWHHKTERRRTLPRAAWGCQDSSDTESGLQHETVLV